MRKSIIAAFLVVILIAASPMLAVAHSGRTDSFGGHYNSKTGQYHYHNSGKETITPKDLESVERRQQLYNTTDGPKITKPSTNTPTKPTVAKPSTATPAKTTPKITVLINGQPIEFSTRPIVTSGRVLVPLRGVFEALGATVDWQSTSKTVTAKRGNMVIVLKVGEKKAKVDGVEKGLDVPSIINNSSTMVPLRFVSEALGANVGWDEANTTVTISNVQ